MSEKKTPMQEYIEVLKIHRDTAFKKAAEYKDQDIEGLHQWHDFRGQALNDAISFAEAHLEKEKEAMCDFVRHCLWSSKSRNSPVFPGEHFDEYFNTEKE